MEREPLRLIPAITVRNKITPLVLAMLAVGLCLLAYMLSDLQLYLLHLDLALCDLRRKLAQIPKGDQAFSFTVTASPTPDTRATVASAPRETTPMQTENI